MTSKVPLNRFVRVRFPCDVNGFLGAVGSTGELESVGLRHTLTLRGNEACNMLLSILGEKEDSITRRCHGKYVNTDVGHTYIDLQAHIKGRDALVFTCRPFSVNEDGPMSGDTVTTRTRELYFLAGKIPVRSN